MRLSTLRSLLRRAANRTEVPAGQAWPQEADVTMRKALRDLVRQLRHI